MIDQSKNIPICVAYVVHTFHVGGLERCIARLVNHLDRRFFQPIVFCLGKNSDAANWIWQDDIPIIELNKRSGNDPSVIRRFARELRKNRVQIVHSHNWGTLVETSLARRLAGTPRHVHAERGMELEDLESHGMRTWLRGLATRWALNHADAVVSVAESVRNHLMSRCGHLNLPVEVIPNGVDPPRLRPESPSRKTLRDSLNVPEDGILLGSVGRLAPVKDFTTAVHATRDLLSRGTNCHFVLVGDGPERAQIEGEVRKSELQDRFHLVGKQSDVGAWLRAMDVYLNVSLNEGMSQSVLEAMSWGLPLVVTDVGENRALVGGPPPCGLCVPAESSQAVSQAVHDIISDESRRKDYSRNARICYESKYQIDTMIRAYEQLYFRMSSGVTSDTSKVTSR